MSNVFLLQVHQDTDQLRTLISILSNDCDVFIHFDKKQCSKTLSDWIDNNCFTYKVSLIKSRVKVYWAHESQIYATLNLIKEARSYSNYKFYTLLSGDCFPVKPVSEYINFFLIILVKILLKQLYQINIVIGFCYIISV